jgi:hypothetical protein
MIRQLFNAARQRKGMLRIKYLPKLLSNSAKSTIGLPSHSQIFHHTQPKETFACQVSALFGHFPVPFQYPLTIVQRLANDHCPFPCGFLTSFAVPNGCAIVFKSISKWLLAKTKQFLSIFLKAGCLQCLI